MKRPSKKFLDLTTQSPFDSNPESLARLANLHRFFTLLEIIENCLAAVEYMPGAWHMPFSLIYLLAEGFCGDTYQKVYQRLVKRSDLKEKAKVWVGSKPRARRQEVVFVLGKLCDKRYLPVLNLAFRTWRDDDPVFVIDLLFELNWLRDPQLSKKLKYLTQHEHFLNRLAILSCDNSRVLSQAILKQLKKDPHPLVRSCANGNSAATLRSISQIYDNLIFKKHGTREVTKSELTEFAILNMQNFLAPKKKLFAESHWTMPG